MTTMTKTKQKDAISLLKADHKKVKELFEGFEKAKDSGKKHSIALEALKELKIHSVIEEEIFYPSVREAAGEDGEETMNEAEEEHRVAKTLIKELEKSSNGTSHFEAKFMVLAENVRHHIKEEESTLFKQAKETDVDFASLGEEMASRKEELMANEDELESAVEKSAVKPFQELN